MSSARAQPGAARTTVRAPRAPSRIAQLWQLPLLLISLGLFGYAAYLFIDPQPGPSSEERIAAARQFIAQERPEAAVAQLNHVLNRDKLKPEQQARAHLMLAEAIDLGQKQKKISIPANYLSIVEQTRQAVGRGARLDAPAHRRLAEAYEAIRKPSQALDHYRQAMALDTGRGMRLQRKVIELQLELEDSAPAELSLEEYLRTPGLTDAERGWALGQQAQLLIDRGKFSDAGRLLDEALRLAADEVAQGEVNYRLGYCAYKLGDTPEAERYLRVARDQLRTRHPLDADAAYLLGRICQDRGDIQGAISFYEVVLVSHIDSKVAPLARLGRGVCRVRDGQDDAGLTDLHDLVAEIEARATRQPVKPAAIAGLQQGAQVLAGRQNFKGALELLAYEQSLDPDPPAGFYARLGSVYERRAEQLDRSMAQASPADRVRREQEVRAGRSRAGDAYVAYSRKLTLADDKGYGDALWKGIELYDRAGDIRQAIAALELFAAERPEDPLAPEALLRLGRACQSAGLFDRAIEAFQRNQFRYPQSFAASKSAVPLAQAFIARGPESYASAEKVLIGVIENNPLITPEALEFRQALFELAQLYYRTSRFEESVARLEEFTQRYPGDERLGELTFLMADSYRKSAGLLEGKRSGNGTRAADGSSGARSNSTVDLSHAVASASNEVPAVDPIAVAAAKRDRLLRAKALYDKVIEHFRAAAPAGDLDRLYLKLSHFYRADCLFDVGDYAEAVNLYNVAAYRYQDDPSSLAAYVQIVNAYCAMGRTEEARTANERAKLLLRRIPAEAFDDGAFAMPREYWAQCLKWMTEAGLWQARG